MITVSLCRDRTVLEGPELQRRTTPDWPRESRAERRIGVRRCGGTIPASFRAELSPAVVGGGNFEM